MYVYHCSHIGSLRKIIPSRSTHGEKWIYATRDVPMSAVFLSGRGGDFTCCVGRDHNSNLAFICERFEGAFEYRYRSVSGSIYTLNGDDFISGMTDWEEELVSAKEQKVLEGVEIDDSTRYLLNLEKEGIMIIKKYPDKIDGIPADDEDLVERAVVWLGKFGEGVIKQVKMFHPNLVERVKEAIKNNMYQI